jgi:hypothetical protein
VLFIDRGMRRRFGVGVGLIVVDTMIVASGGETDLSNAEAQLVMRVMRGVSNRTNTFVLGVDHHGKDASRGTRGPSDKESSADMVIHVFKDQIDLVKCSEGEQGACTKFKLRMHDIDKDDEGDTITERTVEWGGATKPKLGNNTQRAIDSLQAAERDDKGRVTVTAWKNQMYKDKVLDPEAPGHRTDYKRLWEKLVEAKRIKIEDVYVEYCYGESDDKH